MKKILCLLLCLSISGCISWCPWYDDDTTIVDTPSSPKETVKIANDTVEESVKVIGNVAEKNEASVKVIKSEADKIDEKTKGAVKPEVTVIKNEADKIKTLNDQLIATQSNLKSANSLLAKSQNIIDERDKTIKALLIKVEKSNAEAKKNLNEKLVYLIIGGIILIALCVASAINGNAKAIGGAVIGVITVVSCITIMYMSPELAWVGFIAIVISLILLFVKVKRDLELKRANRELIHSTEAIKDTLDEKKKREIFGLGAKPGLLFNIQSKSTEKIINEERRNQKNMWESTIKK